MGISSRSLISQARALPYSAAWHSSITRRRGRKNKKKHLKTPECWLRSDAESWQVETTGCDSDSASAAPSNQNARGRSVLKTGRSSLRRPDRNRPLALRRNQEVLQSKHTGEKSVEDAASPRRGCALEKVNSTGKPSMAAPPTSFSCNYGCLIIWH